MQLVFKGLDTVSTVSVNGIRVLETDNMFVEYKVDITKHLLSGPHGENVLTIAFDSARKVGLDRVANGPRHEYHVHQTEIGRAAVRKAQFQWGWDWGPVLLTAGPWKPVVLDCYDVCIEECSVWSRLEDDLCSAHLTIQVVVGGEVTNTLRLETLIVDPSGRTREFEQVSSLLSASKRKSITTLKVSDPQLWWPARYGHQNMYKVRITLRYESGDVADCTTRTFAFRKAELVQEADAYGKSFYFRINGVDMFMGGSCWIPADSFLRPINYRQWVELMLEGNQNMVRVWGGGIYEADEFYDACDELGLLVWQDFAFACASYPAADVSFFQSVRTEVKQNVARLQGHPSLVVWAGNNEDYQIKEHYDLGYDPSSLEYADWCRSKFPARCIYEGLLPEVVAEGYGLNNGQAVPYQPGSPYGDTRSTTLKVDPTIGDVHQWNVWHGDMRHYQEYPELGGRFVSEFGMQAYPHTDTLHRAVSSGTSHGTSNSQLWPGSLTMDVRNKAIGHQFRLLKYVADNFRIHRLDDLATFGHLTQVMQADAVSHAYKGFRLQWDSRKCGGALIWQLNDCWPTVSWSVVDYYMVPKPAYYAIKRAMAPLAIFIQQEFRDWTSRRAGDGWQRDTAHVEPGRGSPIECKVWIVSRKERTVVSCVVEVRTISIATGQDVRPPVIRDCNLWNCETMQVLDVNESATQEGEEQEATGNLHSTACVIHARLLVAGQVISTDTAWPDPVKYLEFPRRNVAVMTDGLLPGETSGVIKVTAERPVKGLVFAENAGGVRFSDNGLDVIPGAPCMVTVTRASTDRPWPAFAWMYVGQDIWG